MSAGDDHSYADTAHKSRSQSCIHGLAQFLPPDLSQIGQGDADDERGLNPFAQRNNECLKHLKERL